MTWLNSSVVQLKETDKVCNMLLYTTNEEIGAKREIYMHSI